MSSISSNQSSVGNLILASTRLAASRNAAAANNLPVFGKPSIPASGDLKGLYGQLAKSFLSRRGAASSDTKQAALATAANAASTAKSTSTSSSTRNADGDSVSLTKATNFKKFVRSTTSTQPAGNGTATQNPSSQTTTTTSTTPTTGPSNPPAETPSVTELNSGSFDLSSGVVKVGDVDREGQYTYTDGVSRINFAVTRNNDGSLNVTGQLFRDATKDVSEDVSSELFNGNEIRLANYGQVEDAPADDPKDAGEPSVIAAGPAAASQDAEAIEAARIARRAEAAANLSARLEELGATGISNDDGQLSFTLNGVAGSLLVSESGRGAQGQLGETTNERVDFTLDEEGTLSINSDNGQVNTAAVRENAIYVRSLFGRDTSAGNVTGTGRFAAVGSNVVTTGNADVDRALLNSERRILQNGGTFTRAAGSTSSYAYTQGSGASQITGSLTAQTNGTIDGTYRQSGVSTSYTANAATGAITTTGGSLVSQTIAKTFVGTLLGL